MNRFMQVIYLLMICILSASAQDSIFTPESVFDTDRSDTLSLRFQKGVDLYNLERYWDALNVFEKLVAIPSSENRIITSIYLMLMKTNLRIGNPEECIRLGHEFESMFRGSNYYDDVQFCMGEAFFNLGEYNTALEYFLSVMRISTDFRLWFLNKQTAGALVDIFLTLDNLVKAEQSVVEVDNKIFLSLKLAERYHSLGMMKLAEKELPSIRGYIKGSEFEEGFQKISKKIKTRPVEKIYIGVILPLSGPMADVGNRILNGVRYALHQFRLRSHIDVSAIVIDNRGEIIRSIKAVEYLSENPRLKAIFGPVSSETTIPSAALANQKNIPLITPTATHSKLSSLGKFVFQANVDFENLGRFLGIYCSSVSGIKSIATLSPADVYGKEMTDSFCEAFDEFGGVIVSQQWYSEEPEDLKYQFENIRDVGLQMSQNRLSEKIRMMRDSLKLVVFPDSRLWNDTLFYDENFHQYTLEDSLIISGLMDSSEFDIPDSDTINFRINSIDALFLPSRTSDLSMMVPQLAYYNIDAVVYGGGNWDDPDLLRKNRRLLDGLTFVSDYYIDAVSQNYRNFKSHYSRLIGNAPDRLDYYGYDTMSALLSVFRKADVTREEIRKNLSNMPTYQGICRNISFRGNRPRVNSCAFILKFKGGKIKPVARFENGGLVRDKDSNL